MSRIEACFSALKNNNKKALIPFITAGDPSLDMTVELMHVLTEAGADIIVVGNAIEKDENLISEIANAVHNC